MLPKGQVGKAWTPSNKRYQGALERKYFCDSLQEVNKNDDMYIVIQTFATLAAYQICSENGRWYHMCMAGNGIEIQYLKLKLTVDDPCVVLLFAAFLLIKIPTNAVKLQWVDWMEWRMNVCLNIHISG